MTDEELSVFVQQVEPSYLGSTWHLMGPPMEAESRTAWGSLHNLLSTSWDRPKSCSWTTATDVRTFSENVNLIVMSVTSRCLLWVGAAAWWWPARSCTAVPPCCWAPILQNKHRELLICSRMIEHHRGEQTGTHWRRWVFLHQSGSLSLRRKRKEQKLTARHWGCEGLSTDVLAHSKTCNQKIMLLSHLILERFTDQNAFQEMLCLCFTSTTMNPKQISPPVRLSAGAALTVF